MRRVDENRISDVGYSFGVKYCETEALFIKATTGENMQGEEDAFMFNGSSWKLQRAKRSYFKERVQQQQRLNEEVARLDMLLRENAIDEDTHRRLRKLLEMGYQQKRQETRRKYGFL